MEGAASSSSSHGAAFLSSDRDIASSRSQGPPWLSEGFLLPPWCSIPEEAKSPLVHSLRLRAEEMTPLDEVLVTEFEKTMPLPETMFCAEQIKIPPELPDILKQFTKAAIRTQPRDLLQWSAAYFTALAKGEAPPVKERVEMPLAKQKEDAGLTPGLLKVLHKQLSPKGMVSIEELKEKWKNLCLPEEQLEAILQLDVHDEEVEWMKILALGCSVLGESLLSSMKHACEILTEDPEGGAARVPFETFSYLYSYLASIDGEILDEKIQEFLNGIKEQADQQDGMVQLRNFLSQPSTLF